MLELLDRIVRGEFAQGTALPSEGRLGEQFGVSRTVVRESVKVLTEKGLVTTWRGRGTIVRPEARWRPLDPDILAARLAHDPDRVTVRELLILRHGIEPVLTALAAHNPDEPARAELVARFEELERCTGDSTSYVVADGRFHQQVVAMAQVAVARDLFALLAQPFEQARSETASLPGAVLTAHAQHARIHQAIMERDPDTASAAMDEHLRSAQDLLALLDRRPRS